MTAPQPSGQTHVPDQLRHLVAAEPDAVAYRVVGACSERAAELTFCAWDVLASRLARAFVAAGIMPGDRVALLVEPADALGFLVAYVAVHKAGAVNVPVSPRLAPAELATVVGHAEPVALVASPGLAADVMRLAAAVPGVRLLVSTGEGAGKLTTLDDVLDPDGSDLQVDVGADAMADIVYTSGTTGTPKGVVARHRNATQLPVGPTYWNGMRWFHASPFATVAGLAFVYLPMRMGMTGVYQPRFDPGGFLDLVEGGEVDMAFLVPAMVELLLARADIAARDLSGLRMVTIGSAPLAPASLLRLDELLPEGYVVNGFSLTEAGGTQVVLPADEVRRRPDSVGRPLPPAQVRVVDEEGSPLPAGEVGEVCLRNPGFEREYFRDDAATARTWRDGWLHTGDLGRLDDEGFLYVVGRMKDVIIRGGMNIHAVDVERVLYAHPDIAEAAVVGVPHAVLGEDVAAIVVPRPGARLDVDAVTSWCSAGLAAYKVPRRVEVRDVLPRNAAGKVLKGQLRESLARH